jgi:UDP-N-acetylmuramoyl-L-alanyl-D-glutamate--2,6-diaminopimelate ligase
MCSATARPERRVVSLPVVSPRPRSVIRTSLREVAEEIGARPATGTGPSSWEPRDVHVTGVSLDSRAIRPGDLYAALPGANVHGAAFTAGAVGAGAVAVLTDRAGADRIGRDEIDVPVVVVDRPRSALGRVSALVYGTNDLSLRMVGITGTNGKTTTAYLLTSALEALGHRTGLIGTVETRVGDERVRSVRTTPEMTDLHALLAVMEERGADTCVMEVSSHALSQHRVDGVRYDVAVFTNLSRDHLDYHPTMEDYFLAKADLFTPERARHGIVCVDDEWGRRLARDASVPVETLASATGTDDGVDRMPDTDWVVIADEADPATFHLVGPGTSLDLRSALPGDFNRVNTALAVVALLRLGEAAEVVARAVLTDPHVPGRMETVEPTHAVTDGSAPLAVVDYAHTPDAVDAALRSLRATTSGALVVVVGAGGDRDRQKRPAMGSAAARGADVVVVTDDNPRTEDPADIRAAVLAGAHAEEASATILDVAGRRAAIAEGVRAAVEGGPGSTVLVLGKGHEAGQEIAGVVHPFDDRDELRAALDTVLAGGATA